jgi:hypothetical protein
MGLEKLMVIWRGGEVGGLKAANGERIQICRFVGAHKKNLGIM